MAGRCLRYCVRRRGLEAQLKHKNALLRGHLNDSGDGNHTRLQLHLLEEKFRVMTSDIKALTCSVQALTRSIQMMTKDLKETQVDVNTYLLSPEIKRVAVEKLKLLSTAAS